MSFTYMTKNVFDVTVYLLAYFTSNKDPMEPFLKIILHYFDSEQIHNRDPHNLVP